jgi:hypothetical protein
MTSIVSFEMNIGFTLAFWRASPINSDIYVTLDCASTHEQWCWQLHIHVHSSMPRVTHIKEIQLAAQAE